jgi:hypothetical protein
MIFVRTACEKNKTTLVAEEAARVTLMNPGALPLDYMLDVMRDESRPVSPVSPPEEPPMIDPTPEEIEAKLVDILERAGAINHHAVEPLR